jgi:hypothetical protein
VSTIQQASPAPTNHCSAALSKLAAATVVAAAVAAAAAAAAASVGVLRLLSVSAGDVHIRGMSSVHQCGRSAFEQLRIRKLYHWQAARRVW